MTGGERKNTIQKINQKNELKQDRIEKILGIMKSQNFACSVLIEDVIIMYFKKQNK